MTNFWMDLLGPLCAKLLLCLTQSFVSKNWTHSYHSLHGFLFLASQHSIQLSPSFPRFLSFRTYLRFFLICVQQCCRPATLLQCGCDKTCSTLSNSTAESDMNIQFSFSLIFAAVNSHTILHILEFTKKAETITDQKCMYIRNLVSPLQLF